MYNDIFEGFPGLSHHARQSSFLPTFQLVEATISKYRLSLISDKFKNVHKFVIKNGLNYYSLDSLFTAPYGSTKLAHEILLSVKMYFM